MTMPIQIKLVIASMAVIAAFALGMKLGAAGVRSDWQAETSRHAAERDKALKQVREKEREQTARAEEARKHAEQHAKQLAEDVAAAGVAADSLRQQVARLQRGLSSASAEANRRTADAALDVFQQCADRYRSVAAAADRHASDAVTLSEAWPQ